MANSNKNRPSLNQLESLLRAHEAELCANTSARFAAVLPSIGNTALSQAEINAGAKYTHDLVVIAAALYPSENTLRNEWNWTSTGPLPRHGIGYEHLAAMLSAYFSAAANVLAGELKDMYSLQVLEAFVKKSLKTSFNQSDLT